MCKHAYLLCLDHHSMEDASLSVSVTAVLNTALLLWLIPLRLFLFVKKPTNFVIILPQCVKMIMSLNMSEKVRGNK